MLNHSQVKPFYDKAKQAKDMNEKPCLKSVTCDECPAGQMGSYNPNTRKIILCTNEGSGYTLPEVRETLIHELVHAIQCDPSRNCGHCMRKELEAYYTDGSCTTEAACIAAAWGSCGTKDFCQGKNQGQYMGEFPFPPPPSSSPR